MPRRQGAQAPAFLRAVLPALLIAALVGACAPAAEVASPAPSWTPATAAIAPATPPPVAPPSIRITPAPAPARTPPASLPPAEVVVPIEGDDLEGDGPDDPASTVAPVVAAATPVPTPTPRPKPLPPKEAFALSLYHKNDWVPQYTLTWCVGASIQMMVNIAQPGQDRTKERQEEFMRLAQGGEELNEDRGAGSSGWARTLTELGVGHYTVAYQYSFDDAIRAAARAMRLTRLPVGLLVWGGKHAWVMTGFTSIGDPKIHDDFEVTGVRVLDPLYPRHNADLGPAPQPNALLKPSALDNYFVGWRWRTRNSTSAATMYGSWRLVLPVIPY